MRAPELHRLARQELGPALAGLGFTRTPATSSASWVRPEGDRWLVIWVQPYRSTDPASGSRFTIELRLSSRSETGGDGYRRRLPSLLSDGERREAAKRLVGSDEDSWFGHASPADIHQVLAFIVRVLPRAIDRFLEGASAGGAS